MSPRAVSHASLLKDGVPMMGAAGIALAGDDKLVRACMAEGGFPTAVETSIGTVWAGPDGMPWAGKISKKKRGRV